jgi:CRISPR/Cas system CMR-associated protein Cmr1 (group 7 of RAMP superfamily)
VTRIIQVIADVKENRQVVDTVFSSQQKPWTVTVNLKEISERLGIEIVQKQQKIFLIDCLSNMRKKAMSMFLHRRFLD